MPVIYEDLDQSWTKLENMEENEKSILEETAEVKKKSLPKVSIVVGSSWLEQCDRIPKVEKRTSMTLSLIKSYGLLNDVTPIPARKATREELQTFHSQDYLEFCDKTTNNDDLEKLEIHSEHNFGIEYDCPLIPDIMNMIQWIAGGSLVAAEALNSKQCEVAINWGGGWHHAQRDEAAGFCYVNDIVLAIQQLRQVYDRVLYIDLDVHHGDGVENAFSFSPKVFTFSMHKQCAGYFPGTGKITDVGQGKGRFYTLNFPLKDGVTDDTYAYIFENLLSEVIYSFKPDAIVLQCGADSLSNDPLGGFNLTPCGIAKCISKVMQFSRPTLVLGGGGYNLANASRFWTYLTGIIVRGVELSSDIPDSDLFFDQYGPSFELSILPGRRPNLNSAEEVNDHLEEAFRNLEEIP